MFMKSIFLVLDSLIQALIVVCHIVYVWQAIFITDGHIGLFGLLIFAGFYQLIFSNSFHRYLATFEDKPVDKWRVRYLWWSLISIPASFTPVFIITLFFFFHFLLYLSAFLSFQATYNHFKGKPVDLKELE